MPHVRLQQLVVVIALACVCALFPASSGTAMAAETNLNVVFAAPATQGWNFVRGGRTVPTWTWDGAAWKPATAAAGTPVWTEPFTGEWSWAWYDGAWHAIQTHWLHAWSCNNAAPGTTAKVLRATDAYGFNASTSAVVGRIAAGAIVDLVCTNNFEDAFWLSGEPSAFKLARVRGNGCQPTITNGVVVCNPGATDAMVYIPASAFLASGGGVNPLVARIVGIRSLRGRASRAGLRGGTFTVGGSHRMRIHVVVRMGSGGVVHKTALVSKGSHRMDYYALASHRLRHGARIRVTVRVTSGSVSKSRTRVFRVG